MTTKFLEVARRTRHHAVFRCKVGNLVDDIRVPLREGVENVHPQHYREGEWYAARRFKRVWDLHPSTKVHAEFIRIDSYDID